MIVNLNYASFNECTSRNQMPRTVRQSQTLDKWRLPVAACSFCESNTCLGHDWLESQIIALSQAVLHRASLSLAVQNTFNATVSGFCQQEGTNKFGNSTSCLFHPTIVVLSHHICDNLLTICCRNVHHAHPDCPKENSCACMHPVTHTHTHTFRKWR